MRIGIDIRNIGKQRTGDETVVFNLVKNLAEIDEINEYFLFTDIQDIKDIVDIKKRLGIKDKSNFKIISLTPALSQRERGIWNNKFIWNLWTLPRYLRKNPVDIYHTQYITPFFVPKKIKIITHIHDVSFLAYPEYIFKKDLLFLKLLMPRSLKRADKVIAVSEFTKDEIIKYYKINPEKVEVIYNALGDDFHSLTPALSREERGNISEKYNLPEKFILYVGTLQPRKNIPMLIEAFSVVIKKLPEIKLVIVGSRKAHNFDKKIDETIAKNDLREAVVFPGYIDQQDIRNLYSLSGTVVLPSLYEGFEIPILEAMSQKIPVVASKIPAHEEIAGNAVLYFNPRSLDDFSEKLYNSLIDKNLREKLINLGFQRASFFSWKKSVRKMLDVYKKLN
ncbi:MAG: glycosyltransferase family 1 protein [bacterium]|nr:glycosyltransferase family 1 protein [bacterium]